MENPVFQRIMDSLDDKDALASEFAAIMEETRASLKAMEAYCAEVRARLGVSS